MKIYTLLMIGVLGVSTAFSQNQNSVALYNKKALPDIPSQFFPTINGTCQTTKNTDERSAGNSRSAAPVYDSVYYWFLNRTTKQWNYNEKQIDFTYNANHKITGYIQQVWNDTFSKWQNSIQISVAYTSFDSMASETYQYWTGSVWVNSLQWVYTYDANNNMTTETLQSWSNNAWVNGYQEIRGYNSKNLDTNILIRGYNVTTWDTTEQFIYTYNSGNLDTGELTQLWTSGAWVNSSRITNIYTVGNLDTEYTYSASGNSWANSTLYTYTYNSNNFNTSFEYQLRSSGWVPIEQYLYNYNAKNLDTSTITQLWSGSTWQTLSFETNVYNANNIQVISVTRNYNTAADTVVSGDSIHYYFTNTVGINHLAVNNYQLTVYPNPATNFIHTTIQLNQPTNLELRLINMLGQTLWVTDAGTVSNYQNNISVANLPDGVYLLEMVTVGGSETRELVVNR